jgi:hypothetical protein
MVRSGGAVYHGVVVAWFPLPSARNFISGCVDVAVLRLEPSPPSELRPAWLKSLEQIHGQRVRTAGFPSGYALGRHAQGRVEGSDAGGWLQVISPPGDMNFLPGHSGAPVFLDQNNTVVAMVAMTDDSRRDVALLIPTAVLRDAWPELADPSTERLACNPYRGLDIFRFEDRALFKGRDSYVAKASQMLDQRRLVAIVGASGSGKSSLALAGILPARADKHWITSDFRPRSDPMRNLAASLISHLEPSLTEPGPIWEAADRYAKLFMNGSDKFLGLIQHTVDRLRAPGLLILVDQFEELFTQSLAPERETFLALLSDVCDASRSPVTWLLTIRADFMEHALGDDAGSLPRLLQDSDLMLGPMREADLRDAIELPAAAAGVRFAPGLVERLIDDAVGPR